MFVLALEGKILAFLFQELRLILLDYLLLGPQLTLQTAYHLLLLLEGLFRHSLLIHHLPHQHGHGIHLLSLRNAPIIIQQLVHSGHLVVLALGPVDL